MMFNRFVASVCTAAMLGSSLPAMAIAQSAESDLVGARASSGESEMQRRGYRVAKSQGLTQYWWHSSRNRCVRTVTWNGRYSQVDSASDKDCGKGGGDGTAAAVIGGALAIGLVAALASHHNKSDDRHKNDAHDSEYERGYNDALYGAAYDRNDSDAYHEGFTAGNAERMNRAAANSRTVRGAPRQAQAACARRGDEYQNLPAGSSVPVSVNNIGNGMYEITVASGQYRSRCTVDAYGNVRDMNPY